MGMTGIFFRTDTQTLDAIRKGEVSLIDLLYSQNSKIDKASILDIDKTWHAIHFTLSGKVWDTTDDPLSKIILNGTLVNDEDMGYGPAMFIAYEDLHNINQALKSISRDWFRNRFSVPDMLANKIYPVGDDENEEEFFNYVYAYLEEIISFFTQAENNKQSILFFVN
jgi:hypothetical protein